MLRTPYCLAFAASRIFSISSRSENRTGPPVAKIVSCRTRFRAIGCLVLHEQLLELAHVLERPAVGQRAGRIDRQGVMELESLPVHAVALDRRHLVGHRPVALAVAAHHVEALQREARRVHLAVAGRAARVGPVLLQLLADRHRAADVRLDGLDRRRRGRRLQPQDALRDPVPAQHRRGRRAVGGHLEDAGLRHQAAADAVGRQLHLAEVDARDAAGCRNGRPAAR